MRQRIVGLALDEPELSPQELAKRFTDTEAILSRKPPSTPAQTQWLDAKSEAARLRALAVSRFARIVQRALLAYSRVAD